MTAAPRVAARAKRFGQGALATPANFVTITRILVAIPTLALIRRDGSSWLTVGLWFAITSTDSLDGWLARRDGATRSGAFLDPVADKLIVIGGLAVLADRGVFPWWPVLLIAARELGISLYRSIAGRRGIVLPAQRLGKYKAFTQYSRSASCCCRSPPTGSACRRRRSRSPSCSRSCPGSRSSATATSTGNAPTPEAQPFWKDRRHDDRSGAAGDREPAARSEPRAGAATLVRAGGHTLLFDAGRGVCMRMAAAGVLPVMLDAVVLTHLHSDHICDLNDVVTTQWVMSPQPKTLPIFGPPGTQAGRRRDAGDACARRRLPPRAPRRSHWDPQLEVIELDAGVVIDDGRRAGHRRRNRSPAGRADARLPHRARRSLGRDRR